MNPFIQNLLLINAGIAIVIAAFILLRHLLKSKVHTSVLCILWIIIFLRMLLPVPIRINLSIVENNPIADTYTAAENYVFTLTNNAAENEMILDESAMDAAENTQPIESPVPVNKPVRKFNIAMFIYISGAAAALMYVLISNMLFNLRIKRHGIEIELGDAERQVFADQNIKPIKVLLVEDLRSPCLVGILKPKITLNEKSTATQQIKRYSLYHETTHYKNKDNLVLLLGLTACIINWFNPMLWLALHLSKKDREVQCDEQVIKKLGEDEVINYGKSLLFVSQKRGGSLLALPNAMTGGIKEMKHRIKNLASNKKCWIVMSILTTFIIISLLTIISCSKPDNNAKEDEPNVITTAKPDETTIDIEPEIISTTNPADEIAESGFHLIGHMNPYDDYTEYTNYFDNARDGEDILIYTLYKSDINEDGIYEIYTRSHVSDIRFPQMLIECYDLKTDTYSYITSTKDMAFVPMDYDGKMYIFGVQEEDVNDFTYHAFEPYLSDGELRHREIDADLEEKIIDAWMVYSILGNEVHQTAEYTLNIAVYELSNEVVLVNNYFQKTNEETGEILLITNMDIGTKDVGINQKYMAVVTLKYANREQTVAIYFGESNILSYKDEGNNYNFENDELLNFLNAIANGTYSESDN